MKRLFCASPAGGTAAAFRAGDAPAPGRRRPVSIPGLAPVLAIFAILAIVAVVFWDSARELGPMWNGLGNERTYTHGWLIAAICLWLVYRDRARLARLERKFHPLALIGTAAGVSIWAFGASRAYLTVELGALPIIAWFAVCTCMGPRVAMRVLFPFAFFCLALPVWSQLDGLLVSLTVLVQGVLLKLAGIDFLIHGSYIDLSVGTFMIESGCNGLHYLLVALTVSALLGELRRASIRDRLLILALAMATAMAANWLRIFSLVLMGQLTGMTHPLVIEGHYGYGWMIFALALLLFLAFVERRLEAPSRRNPGAACRV